MRSRRSSRQMVISLSKTIPRVNSVAFTTRRSRRRSSTSTFGRNARCSCHASSAARLWRLLGSTITSRTSVTCRRLFATSPLWATTAITDARCVPYFSLTIQRMCDITSKSSARATCAGSCVDNVASRESEGGRHQRIKRGCQVPAGLIISASALEYGNQTAGSSRGAGLGMERCSSPYLRDKHSSLRAILGILAAAKSCSCA